MASSEEFKQAIREGRLNDAFVLAMSKAPELHITTWIASAESSTAKPEAGKCLRTHINLVEGEITNEIGTELIEDPLYQKAQQFHIQQISQGHQTISHNLESLQQMLRLMAILQKQKQGESYQPLEPFKISTTSLPEAEISQFPENKTLTQTDNANLNDVTPIAVIAEEDSLEDSILSLSDLEAAADKIPNEEVNPEDADWGDWLEDEEEDNNLDLDADLLTLDAFEIDDSEEWGDETEFLPDSTVKSVKHNENDP